jgi:DNA-directed RNA polymerase subunit RPC12/RpoP
MSFNLAEIVHILAKIEDIALMSDREDPIRIKLQEIEHKSFPEPYMCLNLAYSLKHGDLEINIPTDENGQAMLCYINRETKIVETFAFNSNEVLEDRGNLQSGIRKILKLDKSSGSILKQDGTSKKDGTLSCPACGYENEVMRTDDSMSCFRCSSAINVRARINQVVLH